MKWNTIRTLHKDHYDLEKQDDLAEHKQDWVEDNHHNQMEADCNSFDIVVGVGFDS